MLRVVQWSHTTKAFHSFIHETFDRLLQVFYEQVFKELQSKMLHQPHLAGNDAIPGSKSNTGTNPWPTVLGKRSEMDQQQV